MMISSPNIVGLRTSTAASRMISSSACAGRSPWAMCRTQFSIITTELSTIMPKSMAPRLSRLAAMPKRSMPEKANSIDSGMASATISAARRLPRNRNSTATTSSPPSNRLLAHRVDDVVDQLGAVVDRSRPSTFGGSVALISSSLSFSAQVTSWLFSPMSMKPRPSTTSPLPSAVTAPRRISWPICHVGHVADADRHAVLGRDDDVLDLRRR